MLQTEHLSRIVSATRLVDDVSISVREGEVLAVIGPSGAGKSSFLRLLNRLDEPTSGTVYLAGQDYRQLRPRELRRRVGLVTQIPSLFPGTIADNLRFGPRQRGFAVKFYTEEGNWDLVGNNTPVFFVRDPYKFPDFIRTQKRDPKTNLRSPTAMWDFWSLSPESLHQVTILFSDRGLPKSYRHMNGYGSHTYSFINAKNQRFWVKFHFKTLQGIACLTDSEAAQIVGTERESHQRDLFEAIKRGDFPQWRLCIQVMPEEDAEQTSYHPFDLTKVWPHKDYPLIEVGILELNHNPENYFAEVEQAAFEPSNIVPGISFSPDKMLQFRIFAYADAHRYRLGSANYSSLPVNQSRSPVHSYHRDGFMRFDGNGDGVVNYEPNSFNGPVEDRSFKEPPLHIAGDADRYDHREGNDDYTQAGNLFRLMKPDEKARLIENLVNARRSVPRHIQERQLQHFCKADPEYGKGVARGLGLPMSNAA